MEWHAMGIGIDVVDMDAMARARFKERLAEYFLMPQERSFALGPKGDEYLASRFAAKEAVIKACPEKLSPFMFVIEKQGNKPSVRFLSSMLGERYQVTLSLTHTARTAAAVALVHAR